MAVPPASSFRRARSCSPIGSDWPIFAAIAFSTKSRTLSKSAGKPPRSASVQRSSFFAIVNVAFGSRMTMEAMLAACRFFSSGWPRLAASAGLSAPDCWRTSSAPPPSATSRTTSTATKRAFMPG